MSRPAPAPRARRRTVAVPESAIVKQIVGGFAARRIPVFRIGVGAFPAVYNGRERFVRMSTPGLPDLLALLPGKVLLIEVKTKTGRLSPEQVAFRNHCLATGNLHVVARDWSDVEPFLGPPR